MNDQGQVIGINAIVQRAQGIGFAIPGDVVRSEVEQLIARGHVANPWFRTASGEEVTPPAAAAYNLGTDHGIVVASVVAGSPAERRNLH